ncbi:cupin domain-containing protein [Paenarthrobacter aurescens]|uniref:cupin domain-containing protein n=1 Tax=Paenarthrobacter aurescens TaxID=43663 RepID=UPI0035ECF58C
MHFVRPFNFAQARETGFPGYSAQFLSSQESGLVIGSWIEPGGCGPRLHYHLNDQSYFLVHGEMKVQIGDVVHDVSAGSFVHIPQGVAHRNWNDSSGQEFHIELIIPAPLPGTPLMYPVDTPGEAPGSDAAGFVLSTRDDFIVPDREPNIEVRPLLHNERSVINVTRMAPGAKGPGTHIHEFDQYYIVLEGVLQIQVALERYEAPAGSLVLLPAGVPHQEWNDGPGVERHVEVLSPAPREGMVWDRGVDFSFKGVQ